MAVPAGDLLTVHGVAVGTRLQLALEPRLVEAEGVRMRVDLRLGQRRLILKQEIVHLPVLALRPRGLRRLGGELGVREEMAARVGTEDEP